MSDVRIPSPNEGATIEELVDLMYRYKKELEFILMNLDGNNVPIINSLVEDIDGNFTNITQNAEEISLVAGDVSGNTASIVINSDAITSIVSDVSGNASSITQNADAITSIVSDVLGNAASIVVNSNAITSVVSDVNDNASSITQNADNINLRVEKTDYDGNTIASLINQSATTIDISANKINLNGVTTMNGLTNVNDDLILGDGSDSKISFRYYSNEAGYIKGGSYGVEIGCASAGDPVRIKNPIILSGNLLMEGEDIQCDDISCDDISCDGLRVDNELVYFGVRDGDSLNFKNSSGSSVGGINFSTGVIY